MKTIKNGLFFYCMIVCSYSFAQIGRHEQPTDTSLIGGKQQEMKTIQMKGRDDLSKELAALKDSIGTTLNEVKFLSEKKAEVNQKDLEKVQTELTQYQKQLLDMMNQLRSEHWSGEMTQQHYKTLQEVRQNFNRLRKDF